MELTIVVETTTYAVLKHMASLRRIPLAEVAAKILNDECRDAVVIEFPSKVPGARRSRGR